MITPAYSPTATERVLPRMALDFTTGVLDSRVTITRALNTATRVNSSGFVEIVNANLPRFDYDPATLAAKGLLIEEARTNIALYSEQFDNALWVKANSSVTPNAATSPDSTVNADLLVPTVALGQHRLDYTSTSTAATHAFSVYAKAAGYGFVWLRIGTSGGVVSLTDGSVGAQLEVGAFATSYIPTTTTSLTRNTDNVSMTGTNFSDWYNASEGAFVTQVSLLNISAGHLLTAFQGYSDVMRVRMLSSIPTANITVGGASQFNSTSQGSLGAITTNEIFSSALAYKQNDTSFAAKGVSVSTDTSVNLVAAPSRLAIGSLDNVGSGSMTGHMRRVFYYPQRLSNAEIAAFSK
jgi:hypothetical protein